MKVFTPWFMIAVAGCTRGVPLEDHSCPCVSGFTCVDQTCRHNAPIDDPALVQLGAAAGGSLPQEFSVPDPTGTLVSMTTLDRIDLSGPFFQDLGTNGRRCVTCHLPTASWSTTPRQLRAVFEATFGGALDDGLGLGAVFRLVDGANSPSADDVTLDQRRAAYSMLLDRGVIRIGLPLPADAEFELVAVEDPYRHASVAELSLFRRPLPTTNLKFLSTVMWDGRGSHAGVSLGDDLRVQASDEHRGHAQSGPLAESVSSAIVDFEVTLVTAQRTDAGGGALDVDGARGGPDAILEQIFYIGINDLFGDSRTQSPFSPSVFDLYDAWPITPTEEFRRSVEHGQTLFNSRTFEISGVSGINDEAAFGRPLTLTGTCTTCHDAPNAGNHSVAFLVDLGLSDDTHRTSDLPLYTLRNKVTGAMKQTSDPGRALITGKWRHVNRFKIPNLRGLAGRAPYFHNGAAADLAAVVDFYDTRFAMLLSPQDKADLVAFLRSL